MGIFRRRGGSSSSGGQSTQFSSVPSGTPVGTAMGGGTLVSTGGGQSTPAPFTFGGGGGGGSSGSSLPPDTPVASTPEGTLLASGEVVPQSQIPPGFVPRTSGVSNQRTVSDPQRRLTLKEERELGLRSRPKTQPNLFLERRLEREAREKRQEREFQSFEKSPREMAIDLAIEERTGMRPGTPESLLGDEGSDAVFGHNANVPALETETAGDIINETQRQQSVISATQRPEKPVERLRFNLGQKQQKFQTQALRKEINVGGRAALFGLNVASTITEAGLGIKQFFKDPANTIINAPGSTKQLAVSISKDLKSSTPEAGLGKIGGLYLSGKAIDVTVTKVPVKVIDRVRTTGLPEIPKEKIIAPEIAKGQTFPTIKKGQTAGSLLKEFQSKPGDPKGFTASPKPFAKSTQAGVGTSELSGVYQAPKLSTRFLKVASEEKALFGLNPFGTLRPTATRITPTSFELAKGVKPGQTAPAGRVGFKVLKVPVIPTKIAEIKQFFKFQKAPTVRFGKDPQGKRLVAQFSDPSQQGKSIVAFMKTEKEAIIPAGTQLTQTGRSGFFKFEGRRIPIQEFSTSPGGTISKFPTKQKSFSTSEISSISSRKVGKQSIFTPTEVVKQFSSTPQISSSNFNPSRGGSSGGVSSISPKITPSSIIISPSITSSSGSSRGGSSISQGLSFAPSISKSSPTSFIKITSVPRSILASKSRSFGGSSYRPPTRSPPYEPPTKTPDLFQPLKSKQTKKPLFEKFPVFVRRRGEFKIAGFGKTRQQAISIGTNIAAKTLAATFKVPGAKAQKIPGFRTKQTKGGVLFIEKRKFRLSKPTETKEIQFFRRKKKGGIF